MSHPHVTEKLPLWVGGDLKGSEALLAQAHLEHCQACRQEAAAYREAMSILRTPPDLPFTQAERSAMRLETMAKIRGLGAPKPKSYISPAKVVPWLLAAAASIPLAMLFYSLYSPHGADEKLVVVAGTVGAAGTAGITGALETDSAGRPMSAMTATVVAQAQAQTQMLAQAQAQTAIRPSLEGAAPLPRRARHVNASIAPAFVKARESSVTRIEFQTENPNIRIIWFTNASTLNPTAKLDSQPNTTIQGDSDESHS